MTFSNGTYSPHPLANPLNTRLDGSNVSFNPLVNRSAYPSVKINNKNLEVPNQDVPLYGTPEWNERYGNKNNKLEVPNQDVPDGDQAGRHGFIRGTSAFRCHDGTIVDFKTRKILYTPNDPNSEYWGNPNAEVLREELSWNNQDDSLSFSLLVNNVDKYRGSLEPTSISLIDIDPRSAKYWLLAEEEASKMQSEMSDYQKELIARFEAHFPKSNLIEESKKVSYNKGN